MAKSKYEAAMDQWGDQYSDVMTKALLDKWTSEVESEQQSGPKGLGAGPASSIRKLRMKESLDSIRPDTMSPTELGILRLLMQEQMKNQPTSPSINYQPEPSVLDMILKGR